MLEIIHKLDFQVLEFIQNHIHNVGADKLFSFITSLGDKGLIWITISILLLASKKNRKVGVMAILALTLATVLGEGVIKPLVQRLRPFIDDPSLKLIISTPSGYSFPSGHTTSSFAVAGILAKRIKKYKIVFWILAFSISFSRLYLLVHYLSDVIVGAIFGLFYSFIILRVFDFRESMINDIPNK